MSSMDSDEEGDVFFDACDPDIRCSIDASCSVECSTSDQVTASWKHEYEVWTSEPTSVEERREKFLRGMGFADESIPAGFAFPRWQGEITSECSFGGQEGRLSGICSTSWSSFSQAAPPPDSTYCIRDLDSENRVVVHETEPPAPAGMLDQEFGRGTSTNVDQSEGSLNFSQLVRKFSWKDCGRILRKATNTMFSLKKKDHKSFCVRLVRKKGQPKICMYDVHAKSLKTSTMCSTKVKVQNKEWMDFSAVYMCQEIQAHGGAVRVLKFSPSGWHLASAGDDCVVRIWVVKEVDSSPAFYGREPPGKYVMDRTKGLKIKQGKGGSRTIAIIPKKVFSISDIPQHEFHGHTSDILDMAWSKLDLLLTASKDKTVRMWRVGSDGCLAVFKHSDYVTCVQFNPVDERYFTSGSIDGKVRVWDVSEKRVVDWDDTRDIITAVTYKPDGKGLIVGNVAGKCRFYDCSGKDMELEKVMRVKKKRSAGNQITSLQFSRGDPSRMVISSADSRIRVYDGDGVTQKFEGRRWRSKALVPPSLTSDGRYLVSAGADSNVYLWNMDASPSSAGGGRCSRSSVCSREAFSSKGVTSVATWHGPPPQHGRHDLLSPPQETEPGPTVCRDRERCSFGTWLLADGTASRVTWPEEKLLPSSCAGMDGGKVSAAWNTVVVTGGRDGVIRCFHNYGLPVKL